MTMILAALLTLPAPNLPFSKDEAINLLLYIAALILFL